MPIATCQTMPNPLPAAAAQPAGAMPPAQVPGHACISIAQPTPLPWRAWYQVFSTYLCLLEEERGVVLSDQVKNSLLFGLLGTKGHKQFAGNPALKTLQTATFVGFKQSIADHFKCPINTDCTIWDLHHHRQGATESAAEFLTALCDIIPDCGYNAAGSMKQLAHVLLLGCRSEMAQLEMLKIEPALDTYF